MDDESSEEKYDRVLKIQPQVISQEQIVNQIKNQNE